MAVEQSILLVIGAGNRPPSQGTGFVVARTDKGCLVLTCNHVVENDKPETLTVGSHKVSAVQSGVEFGVDLALLEVPDLKLAPIPVAAYPASQGARQPPPTPWYYGFDRLHDEFYIRREHTAQLEEEMILQNRRVADSLRSFRFTLEGPAEVLRGHSGAPLLFGKGVAFAIVTYKLEADRGGLAVSLPAARKAWPLLDTTCAVNDAQSATSQQLESWGAMLGELAVPLVTSAIKELTAKPNKKDKTPKFPPLPPPMANAPKDDPNLGRFGDPEHDGLRMVGRLRSQKKSYFVFDLVIEHTDGSEVEGPARFILHPTFSPDKFDVNRRPGKPAIVLEEIVAYGSFIAGAQVRNAAGDWITLEYNVADLPGLDTSFKGR